MEADHLGQNSDQEEILNHKNENGVSPAIHQSDESSTVVSEGMTNGNSNNKEEEENTKDNKSTEEVTNSDTADTKDTVEKVNGEGVTNDKENDKEKTEEVVEYVQPTRKRKAEEEKCPECDFKSWYEEDIAFHIKNTHGFKKRIWQCENCSWKCDNKWEMDYHCRARGHKMLKNECVPCKKCEFLASNKDEAMLHKKAHIPPEKQFECAGCIWISDRLDNLRYHVNSQDHPMKQDYEAVAEAKALAQGTAAHTNYKKKYARDVKKAKLQKGK